MDVDNSVGIARGSREVENWMGISVDGRSLDLGW